MTVFPQPTINVSVCVSMIALQSSLESYTLLEGDTVMRLSPGQKTKA